MLPGQRLYVIVYSKGTKTSMEVMYIYMAKAPKPVWRQLALASEDAKTGYGGGGNVAPGTIL